MHRLSTSLIPRAGLEYHRRSGEQEGGGEKLNNFAPDRF